MNVDVFDIWLRRWSLTADGEPMATASSDLLPVIDAQAGPAMLKVARSEEERRGAAVLAWYGGDGAVRVLKRAAAAVLLERLAGHDVLAALSRTGKDAQATRIICEVVRRLHVPRLTEEPRDVVPLTHWFRALEARARDGEPFGRAAALATELLLEPRDPVVLHGDVHHGNVLQGAHDEWLAIDPKGLRGERGCDYANIFCNPDVETATSPGRLSHRLDIIAADADLERGRLLKWVIAYAGLSAAWCLDDGQDATLPLTVARIGIDETRHHSDLR